MLAPNLKEDPHGDDVQLSEDEKREAFEEAMSFDSVQDALFKAADERLQGELALSELKAIYNSFLDDRLERKRDEAAERRNSGGYCE